MRMVAAIGIVLLFSCSVFAQESPKKRWYAASLDGTTGLFKTWDAENLRQWETNWTFGYDQFTRDPGKLKIGRAPVGVAIGLLDRLEFFESMDVQRHITADNIRTYRLLPGQLPIPAQLPAGVQAFSQVAPFVDVPRATGRSDVHLGLKFNILSERRGNPFSLGIAGFSTLPGQRTATGLNRGLSSGAFMGGFALLVSKTYSDRIRFHVNVGPSFYTDPEVSGSVRADFQNEFNYKAGFEAPAYKRIRFIAEMIGTYYFGDGSLGINRKNPVEAIFGMRVFPREWISFGAGYQPTLHQEGKSGYHGFVVQGAIGTRRNDPPTVTCSVAKASILQADTVAVRANAVDPDGDKLTYSWTASGGKITGTGDTVTFDATNIAPENTL